MKVAKVVDVEKAVKWRRWGGGGRGIEARGLEAGEVRQRWLLLQTATTSSEVAVRICWATGEPESRTIVATNYCDLLMLTGAIFHKLLLQFPEIKHTILLCTGARKV